MHQYINEMKEHEFVLWVIGANAKDKGKLEPGKLVMEVKFTEMLPQIVRDLLPPNAQEFTAVSKYVLCYEKSQYLHGFEYWNETQERKLL